jgi:uncharacterized membrane protein
MKKKAIIRQIASWFFQGLLVIVPLAVLGYVIYTLFIFLDQLIPFEIPGLGILSLLIFITLMGFLGSTIVAQPFKWWFEELLKRVPPLKTMYHTVADLIAALVGNKKRFDKPVMVKVSESSNLYKLGFLTQEDLSHLGIEENLVAVYFPHSYNFSGNLFIVPKSHVKPLNNKSVEVMKFIVSGGVVEMDEEHGAKQP